MPEEGAKRSPAGVRAEHARRSTHFTISFTFSATHSSCEKENRCGVTEMGRTRAAIATDAEVMGIPVGCGREAFDRGDNVNYRVDLDDVVVLRLVPVRQPRVLQLDVEDRRHRGRCPYLSGNTDWE